MDIKNIMRTVLPSGLRGAEKVEKTIKSESATDRDANGQMASGGDEQQHREPMSDEQFEKALEHLKNLSAVKDRNLYVEKHMSEGKRFVLLKDPTGKIIRRIPEAELWTLQVVKDSEKGQLLSKTA